MFDFDAGKLIIIGIVALIVIGPKELPRVLRQVGQAVGKMRRLASEFQGQFMDAMREADLADIKADVTRLAESAEVDVDFNPIADLKTQVTDAIGAPNQPAMGSTAVDAPALAAPSGDSALNSIVLPHLDDAAEEGANSLLAAGIAPGNVEPQGDVSGARQARPDQNVLDAEMQELASALEAEMRTAEPRQATMDAKARMLKAQDLPTLGSMPQDKA
jgi:sec-independent protein translocase protein TatB